MTQASQTFHKPLNISFRLSCVQMFYFKFSFQLQDSNATIYLVYVKQDVTFQIHRFAYTHMDGIKDVKD